MLSTAQLIAHSISLESTACSRWHEVRYSSTLLLRCKCCMLAMVATGVPTPPPSQGTDPLKAKSAPWHTVCSCSSSTTWKQVHQVRRSVWSLLDDPSSSPAVRHRANETPHTRSSSSRLDRHKLYPSASWHSLPFPAQHLCLRHFRTFRQILLPCGG